MPEFKEAEEAEFKSPNLHSYSVPDIPEDAVFSEDITAEYIQRLYEQAIVDSKKVKNRSKKSNYSFRYFNSDCSCITDI